MTERLVNRRELFWAASLLSAMGVSQAQAGGHTGGQRKLLTADEQLELERANEALVTEFVAAYSSKDIDLVSSYLADDIVYQISEGQEDIRGIEAYRQRNAPMFAGLEKIDWKILRSFAIGQLVINDRVDEFYPYRDSRVPRMRFRVSGYFLVQDNKIKVWRDFGYPGADQLIQPAPKS